MAESAGARIGMGLGIVALVVLLAFILEQVAGTDQAAPEATASADAPTDLQFCAAWGTLSTTASADRATEATDGPGDTRDALVRVRDLGFPEAMSGAARAGLLASLDRIEGELDPSYAPTAYPAEADEEAAFSSYLDTNCPA
ncbi:hypothetical protein KUV85_10560 [Nocardioides panacisoli]|uniref:hypothetical protein n=1 Tax=Nocardioides panacisoli TaxID=627624 RepID=UPI001C636316|nr:hypothetical protein [Nocardioides panacisoli]QYJ02780.1 hypothetical protein KUV85_10560 [Nocardioides panacisoli]